MGRDSVFIQDGVCSFENVSEILARFQGLSYHERKKNVKEGAFGSIKDLHHSNCIRDPPSSPSNVTR